MADQQDKWEKLTAMPSEYESNPEIVRGVVAEIQQSKTKSVKTAGMKRHWKKLVAVATSFVLAIGVGIGVYFSLQQPTQPNVVYYDEVSLQTVKVDNVDALVAQNGFKIKYFATSTTQTWYSSIAETGEPAYLMQDLLYIGSNGFDQINLKIVLLDNAVFDFQNLFESLTESITVLDTNILYEVKLNTNNKQQIYAKMEYGGTAYYFEILSNGDAKTVVEQYVTMLLA